MMTSTKVAIGFAIAWFLLNIYASAAAPDWLGDPNFGEKVRTAASIQSLGNLCLIVAIIAIIVTGFKKVMSKQVEHHHTQIHAQDKAIVATHGSNVAVGSSSIVASTTTTSTVVTRSLSGEQLQSIRTLIAYSKSDLLPESDRQVAKYLATDLEDEMVKDEPDIDRVIAFAKKLASLIETVKPISEAVRAAISLLVAA